MIVILVTFANYKNLLAVETHICQIILKIANLYMVVL